MMSQPTEKLSSMARYSRLARTRTFRDGGVARWQRATIGVAGAGQLGSRLAQEIVLSGAQVRVYDFEIGREENLGTQLVEPAVPKVNSVVGACDAIRPGRAHGVQTDIRHVGIAELAELDLLVDCTDDAGLVMPLAHISNGIGLPLLRLAVDGSGESELGRIAYFHGSGEAADGKCHACPMCAYDLRQILKRTHRVGCNEWTATRDPTFAGGALAMMVTGAGLLQAQRIVTGNDTHLVLDQEIVIDADHWQMLRLTRQSSAECLSGHVKWNLIGLPNPVSETSFRELFSTAVQHLGRSGLSLEPYAHPLCTEALCPCGTRRHAVGTQWAERPSCDDCKNTMMYLRETARYRLDQSRLDETKIADVPLAKLGLPSGAMFVARVAGRPPVRFVLPWKS